MRKIIYSYLNNKNEVHIQKAVKLYYKICDEPNRELIYRFSEEELVQMLQQ